MRVSISIIAGIRDKWQSRGQNFPHFAFVLRLVRGSGWAWRCSLAHAAPQCSSQSSWGELYLYQSIPRLILRSASVLAEDFVLSAWLCMMHPSSTACPRVPQGCRSRGGSLLTPQGFELCLVPPTRGPGGFPKTERTDWGFVQTAPNVISSICTLVKSSTAHLVLDISS